MRATASPNVGTCSTMVWKKLVEKRTTVDTATGAQGGVVRPVEQQRGDPDHLAGSEARDLDLLLPGGHAHQHAQLTVEHQEEALRRLARARQGLAGLEPHQGRPGHRLAELVVAQASKQRAAAHRSRHPFDGRPLHGH